MGLIFLSLNIQEKKRRLHLTVSRFVWSKNSSGDVNFFSQLSGDIEVLTQKFFCMYVSKRGIYYCMITVVTEEMLL